MLLHINLLATIVRLLGRLYTILDDLHRGITIEQ